MIEFGWILSYQSVDKVNYWENVSCLLIKNQREYLWCHWQWFSCLWVKIKLKFKLNTIFRRKTAPRTSRTWKRMIYSNEAQTTISFWWFFQETKENIKFQSISIQAICGQTHLVIVSENWQSNVNQNWTIILGFLWWQHVIWLSKVVKKKADDRASYISIRLFLAATSHSARQSLLVSLFMSWKLKFSQEIGIEKRKSIYKI